VRPAGRTNDKPRQSGACVDAESAAANQVLLFLAGDRHPDARMRRIVLIWALRDEIAVIAVRSRSDDWDVGDDDTTLRPSGVVVAPLSAE